MIHRAFRYGLFLSLSFLLFACSGDEEITDFTVLPEVRLESFAVVSGGTLLLDEEQVEVFDPSVTGPYRIDLDTPDTAEITVNITAPSHVALTLFRGTSNSGEAIVSGEDTLITLTQGVNRFRIQAASTQNAGRVDYIFQANRISSSAALQDVLVGGVRGSLNNNGNVSFDSTFSADDTDYTVTLSKTTCGITFLPEPENRNTEITINGVPRAWRESVFFHLDDDNPTLVTVDLVAEDGSANTTYTFNLVRAAEDDSDRAKDANLSGLSLSAGRATTPFRCTNAQTVYSLSPDDSSLALTAEALADHANVAITFGQATLNEEGIPLSDAGALLFDEDTAVTLTPGTAYSGDLLANLTGGVNYFVVRVVSDDESATKYHQLVLNLGETNKVYVSSAAELQTALQGASANDEIILESGDYLGDTTSSGDAQAYFFSAVSGTVDEPIILRADTDDVHLMGDDQSVGAVLLLQGSYWRVEDIEFSGAQNGVVLDGASNVVLAHIDIHSVGERGVVMQNATSNSQVEGGSINRTGELPQTRVGITEVYGEGVVIGEGAGTSSNNAVRRVAFGRDVANEHIEVKANAADSTLQFNIFETDNTLAAAVSDRSIITASGGSNDISYNQFEYSSISGGSDDISQFISIASDASADIYQNIFVLNGAAITAVNNAGTGTVTLADNQSDTGALLTAGTTSVGTTPVYQIQSTLDNTQCFSIGDTTNDSGTTFNDAILLVDCADDVAQQWVLLHDEAGYVQIAQANSTDLSQLSNKLAPISSSNTIDGQDQLLIGIQEDTGEVQDAEWNRRWLVNTDGALVSFSNRAFPTFFAAEANAELIDDVLVDPVAAFFAPDTTGFEVRFRLVPQ